MNLKRNTILIAFALFVFAGHAFADGNTAPNTGASTLPANECTTSSGTAPSTSCYSNNANGVYYAPTGDPSTWKYLGGRSDPAASPNNAGGAIDVWNYCRYINNVSPLNSMFIPMRSSQEWMALINYAPTTDLAMQTCARPGTMQVLPDVSCTAPSPTTFPVSLPYMPTGATVQKSVTFSCTGTTACGATTTWTETGTATFTAGDSDIKTTPDWTYSMTTPYSNTTQPLSSCEPGVCGSANATAAYSAPASNLCSTGQASSITGSGPWNWTCAGVDGGPAASCWAGLDGQCGTSSGTAFNSAPTYNLCVTGTPTAVAGSGPWTWSCVGNSGTTALCKAPVSTVAGTQCTSTPFGVACEANVPAVTSAHGVLYQLTPIPDPLGYYSPYGKYANQLVRGNMSLITAAALIPNTTFDASVLNIPDEIYTVGFPGYPNLTEWFGLCYDAGFNAPTDGNYQFVAEADDGMALWIDGNFVFDDEDAVVSTTGVENNLHLPGAGGEVVPVTSIHLTAGLHSVRIQYIQTFPSTLGAVLWAMPPGTSFSTAGCFPYPELGIPNAEGVFSTTCAPSNDYLMQLTAPPNGTLTCPGQ